MTDILSMITIVDRSKSNAVIKLYQKYGIAVFLATRGHGTANSEIMDILGLDEPEKELIIALAAKGTCAKVFSALNQELHFSKPGTGIAFTLPLSGISKRASGKIEENYVIRAQEEEAQNMQEKNNIEMLVAVIDGDTTDSVIAAAKAVGARGGTVIKGREIALEENQTIFGLTIQPEREVVIMLVPEDIKKEVFKAICAVVLEQTGEHAYAFSMPVADTVGLK